MERGERIGLGVAGAGHLILFGLLSVGFLATPNPLKLKSTPLEVTLSDDVAMEAEAPQATEAPAQSVAPEIGKPEEAAPAAPQEIQPEPAPPAPAKPEPAPATKPVEVAKPKPVKPAPVAKPQPKQVAARPAAAKPQPTPAKEKGTSPAATAAKARGSRLGPNFLKGISDQPSKSKVQVARAAKVGARDLASIAGLIKRQVQPCYELGSLGGTSAMDIVTILRLQFRPDGSVSAATVSDQEGVNAENRAYARQMAELSRRAVLRCSPLKGLPPELYQGGWDDIDMGFTPRTFG